MLEITVELKNTILDTYKIDKSEITIGRNSANDIAIDNLAVSDRHARIYKSKGAYVMEDLDSTNGTIVNGRKIKQITLRGGLQVEIGKHILLIEMPDTKDPSSDFARTMKM
jgi:pSer/pThr/pTyr-binding forkhead associated (FHA) protein